MPIRQGDRRRNGLLARKVGEIALTIKVVEIGAIFEVADRGARMIEVGRLGVLISAVPKWREKCEARALGTCMNV